MKKIYWLLLAFSIFLTGCAVNVPKSVLEKLYKYSGDINSAGLINPSDLIEIDGVIKQQGRAYVAAVDGVQVAARFDDFFNPIYVTPGQRNLTIRYFDRTSVQCQVKIQVSIKANEKYKVVLQSDKARENIKMTLANSENGSLLSPLVLAARLRHPFNRASIIPIEESTFSTPNGTGCH